ncbi:MAG: TolC family protein [Polyangiaceae bacterium]|nr:TolC family protein [Polyangiaceae bacterium]
MRSRRGHELRITNAALALTLLCSGAMAEDRVESSPIVGEAAERFTLEEATRVMEETHPLLLAASKEVDAGRADAVGLRAWTNPTLMGSYTNAWNSTYDRIGLIGASLTQTLELAGAPAARGRAAQHLAESMRMDRESLRLDLRARLHETAIAFAEAEERRQIAIDTVRRFAEVVNVVRVRVTSGAAPSYDLARIELAEAAVAADLAGTEADLERAKGEFQIAMGRGATRLRGTVKYDLRSPPTLPSEDALLGFVRERSPDVASLRARVRAAEESASAARRAVFPGIGVSIITGYGQGPNQVDLGGALSLPIPLLDRGQGKIAAAEARIDAARERGSAKLLEVETLVQSLLRYASIKRASSEAFNTKTAAIQDRMLSQAQDGYKGGRLSVLELSDAFTSFRDAKLRSLTLAAEAHQASASLGRFYGLAPSK